MKTGTETGMSGIWQNELSSRLELVTLGGSEIAGSFEAGVGASKVRRSLTGFYDASPQDGSCALGFVVSWPEERSVTVWSGRYEAERDVIVTTWLLSSGAQRDEWRSITIGHDEFRRSPEDG